MDENKQDNIDDTEVEEEKDNKTEISGLDETQSIQTEAQAMDVDDVQCSDNVSFEYFYILINFLNA